MLRKRIFGKYVFNSFAMSFLDYYYSGYSWSRVSPLSGIANDVFMVLDTPWNIVLSTKHRVPYGRFSRGESSFRRDFFGTPNCEQRSDVFATSRETRTLGPVVVYLCVWLFRAAGTDVCAYIGCVGPTVSFRGFYSNRKTEWNHDRFNLVVNN